MMWIEVLSRHGDVAVRQRVASDEARIGRAFDNDVVVDDPHVAPHHLRIHRAEDGELVAEDLGTLNGIYSEHGAHRVTRLALAKEPGIRIGRTVIRVRDAARPVEPEKLLTPPRAHARWALALGSVFLVLLLLVHWLEHTGEPNTNAVLLSLLAVVTLLALWTSFWSVVSRIFFGQARFALQLRIALTACLVLLLWDQVSEMLAFGFASRLFSEYQAAVSWAILAATCYAHLRAIGTRHMNFAMGMVVALVTAAALLQYVGVSESRKLIGQRATLGDLRPPALRMAPLASADEFFRRAEGAKRRVDAARLKEPAVSVLAEPESSE